MGSEGCVGVVVVVGGAKEVMMMDGRYRLMSILGSTTVLTE